MSKCIFCGKGPHSDSVGHSFLPRSAERMAYRQCADSFTKLPSLYFPVMDNGSQLGRIGWAMSMIAMVGSGVLRGRDVLFDPQSYPYPDGNANIATQTFL